MTSDLPDELACEIEHGCTVAAASGLEARAVLFEVSVDYNELPARSVFLVQTREERVGDGRGRLGREPQPTKQILYWIGVTGIIRTN